MKVAQGRRLVAVPIENADLYDVAVLAQRALYLNDPDLDQSTILTTVSRLSVMDEPFTPTPRGR